MRRLALLALALALAPAVPAAELRRGPFAVEVNEQGLLVGASGEGVCTVDGLPVDLTGEFAEWFSVSYDSPEGRREFVGLGTADDWAGREPVVPVSFDATAARVIAVTRAGDLEVRSFFRIDEDGRLIAQVKLTNVSAHRVDMIFYTREWRTPATPGGRTLPYDFGLGAVPADVVRRAWMPDGLAPGASRGMTFSYEARVPSPPVALVDVPLVLWTSPAYPTGLVFGADNGISWGDYDQDGWPDVFSCNSGDLWHNDGGTGWSYAGDLDVYLPATSIRYGSSFGDYDNDGLPDIGTEPRGFAADPFMNILRNLGGGVFVNVATDPAIVDVQPYGDSETICWGDVDGDADLDVFLPVYPPWVSSVGNWFLWNLGPTGPGGAYRFREAVVAAGLDNPPPDSARPEGAQMVDVDADGDLEVYSNGTLYQNRSSKGTPSFQWQTEAASGIGDHDALDEGAVLFDYDLDGDFDLAVVYTFEGVKMWEAYGDGMYFYAGPIVDSPFTGLDLGMSAEDWDQDGDIDFTTRSVFRRNMFLEEGARHFTVATHSIDGTHLTSATPAWADWDRDGDLDSALGNWLSVGHFYENLTYGASTPAADRRYIRVRAVRDSTTVARGLETEYGAVVDLRLLNLSDGFRRKKFSASSNGYLNQNEYTLHFGLPADPLPADPTEDLRMDVTVNFPNLPVEGTWRVDKRVNPALGDVKLQTLVDREIKVYRCGRVVKDGVTYDPPPGASPLLVTTTGGLALAGATTPLPAPVLSPTRNFLVGLAFDTRAASESIRVKELILDGQLGPAVGCTAGGPFNVALFDVTDPIRPAIVARLLESTSARNRRTSLPFDVVLPPGRDYRLVARVDEYRMSPVSLPVPAGPARVTGGLAFDDIAPCSGVATVAAAIDATGVPLAIRFSPSVASELADPIGNQLRLVKRSGDPELHWPGLYTADGYDVFRCDARASRPCALAPFATAPALAYLDTTTGPAAGEHYWYQVAPFVNCPMP